MNERDKDIVDIRRERDELAKLVLRLCSKLKRYATNDLGSEGLIETSRNYLKRKGLDGGLLR